MTQPLIDLGLVKDTAIAASEPKVLAEHELVAFVVPPGHTIQQVDLVAALDRHNTTPRRATGTHNAATVKSFIDITERHAGPNLTVWVHPTSGAVTAVLNDHDQHQAPAWGDHRVELALVQTEEWKRWTALDGSLVEQQAFAEHIQDGLTEIARPSAAELLEVVTTMQGNVGVSWQSGVSLRDGAVQMKYVETPDATAGRDGELSVPQDFTLVMAPFIGESPVQINAKLRWRVNGGKLTIGYKLEQPDRVIREVLERIAGRLDEQFPGVVYTGTPAVAR
jgi:uncharacterized protein YfdQ (DUF2303 family)